MSVKRILTTGIFILLSANIACVRTHTESTVSEAASAPMVDANGTPLSPFRTFIVVQRYNMENNGEPSSPISNVRLEITFPGKSEAKLPEGGQFWPIGNGQVQEINRTFEIPWEYVQGKDGFKFNIQMVRKGSRMLPCEFDVKQISQFNRSYVCHTDLGWQATHKILPEKQDKEGVQIRVFTDKNSMPNEVPSDAIAIR